jgi:hypothetical protein
VRTLHTVNVRQVNKFKKMLSGGEYQMCWSGDEGGTVPNKNSFISVEDAASCESESHRLSPLALKQF